MEESEWREFTLSPDDIDFNESGELIVRSERVREALKLALAERERRPGASDVSVKMAVNIKP